MDNTINIYMKVFVVFQVFLCGVSASFLRKEAPVQNGCNETHNITNIKPFGNEPIIINPAEPTLVPNNEDRFFPDTEPDYVPDPDLYPYSIGGGLYRKETFRKNDEESKLDDKDTYIRTNISNIGSIHSNDISYSKISNITKNDTGINVEAGNVTVSINGNGVNVTSGSNQTHIETNHTSSGVHIHVGDVSIDIDSSGVAVETEDDVDYTRKGEKQVVSGGWYYSPKQTNGN